MARTILWTAPDRLIGESKAAELREAGVPVSVGFTTGFGEAHPLGPVELIIDVGLLDDPEIKMKIEEILSIEPLTEEDVSTIEEMEFHDDTHRTEDNPPRSPYPWTLMIPLYGLALLVIVLLILLRLSR